MASTKKRSSTKKTTQSKAAAASTAKTAGRAGPHPGPAPDEPGDRQWGLRLVRAREALSLLSTLPGMDERVDWHEVTVAHVDTGFTRHPALGFGAANPWVFFELGVNYMEPQRFPDDPLDYGGSAGHGTRTLSVLTGNLPGEYVGVAPSVAVVPYRVANTVVLNSKRRRHNVASAIRHAVDHANCEIVTISMGTPWLSVFADRPMAEAVDHAWERGVLVVAAGGQIIDRPVYPAKFRRSIGVGGVRPDRTAYQEYGDGLQGYIDVWAPADPVWRANSTHDPDAPNGERYGYGWGDGTSYATPHVAGAAAMWLALNEEAIERTYREPWQRVEAFRALLGQSCQPMAGDYQPAPGAGVLDIRGLLEAPLPAPRALSRQPASVDVFGPG